MKNFSRYDRMLAMILTFAMIAGASACKHKTKTTETSVSESATEASTSESETTETTESTTDTTPDATSETTEATTTTESTAVPESTDPSDTSETAVPSDNTSSTPVETTVAPADPTKAPATPKPTKAPKATSAPKPTAAPATSTPTPTTKPTDTPTPTTAPKSKDPGLRKNTGIGAAKDAVKAKCGSHDGFEFNDTVMSNEQARAKACADNQTFYGHGSISGTFIPLESASSITGYIFDDGSEQYFWTDHSGVEHTYSSLYDCVYACAAYDVTQHTGQLTTDTTMKYYGVGFYGFKDPWTEQEYGIITYTYFLYIGAEDDISRNARGY